MRVIGTIQLTLDFNNVTVPVTFCVLDHLYHDVILGMNYLKQTNANIYIPSKVVTLYDGLVGVNLTRPEDIVLRYLVEILYANSFGSSDMWEVAKPETGSRFVTLWTPSCKINKTS